jgi:hypothetical protein
MTSANDFYTEYKRPLKAAGLIATVLAAMITAQFGLAMGHNMLTSASLAGGLVLCTFAVSYGPAATTSAWMAGHRQFAGVMAIGVFIAAVLEFTSHTGFTAANRIASIQTASMQGHVLKNKDATSEDLAAQLAAARANMPKTPIMSEAEAAAAIANAKSHKYWNATGGCTATLGPITRGYCDKFQAAIAAAGTWSQIAKATDAIDTLQTRTAEARKDVAGTKVETSFAESQGVVLANMLSQSLEPGKDAEGWSQIAMSALFAGFMISFGMLVHMYLQVMSGSTAATKAAEVMQDAAASARSVFEGLTLTSSPYAPSVGHINRNHIGNGKLGIVRAA